MPLKVAQQPAAQAYEAVAGASNEVAGRLAARLAGETRGEVLFTAADRGRYATDASIYQVMPVGVFVPRSARRREAGAGHLPRPGRADRAARRRHQPMRPDRGRRAGDRLLASTCATSCTSTSSERTAEVEPGLVLDHLNAALKQHGLWFPVDVSTSAQATLGGMAGNNSCGSRSIAYGNMVHNVLRGAGPGWPMAACSNSAATTRARAGPGRSATSCAIWRRPHRSEIEAHWPKVHAPRGGLQPGHLRQPERAALHGRRIGQPGAPAGGQRGHAGADPFAHAAA